MIYSVHQPQYLPWLGFFDKLEKSDCFVFLDQVEYKHREFQNRNKIRTKDGWIWLTVPVLARRGVRVKDVLIDDEKDWASRHLKSLKSWYARAPYFDTHIGFFEKLYGSPWKRLAELNVAVTAYIAGVLGIKTRIVFESELGAGGQKTERIINIGKQLGARTYLSGAGGRDYLEEGLFGDAGIRLAYQDYAHPVYRQQFMKDASDFLPYMSVVDLIFNEGDASRKVFEGGSRHV